MNEEQICTANEMLDQHFQKANSNELVSYQNFQCRGDFKPAFVWSEKMVEFPVIWWKSMLRFPSNQEFAVCYKVYFCTIKGNKNEAVKKGLLLGFKS